MVIDESDPPTARREDAAASTLLQNHRSFNV